MYYRDLQHLLNGNKDYFINQDHYKNYNTKLGVGVGFNDGLNFLTPLIKNTSIYNQWQYKNKL